MLQNLPFKVRIVEICKIKTSGEFTAQWEIRHTKIQHRHFSAEFIHWKKCCSKLTEDAWYPEDLIGESKNFKVLSVDDILPARKLMLPIIKSFHGDPEKFYPQFYETHCTKIKLSIKDIFSNYDQIRSSMRIWSHLLKKSLMENFIFCAMTFSSTENFYKNLGANCSPSLILKLQITY